MVVQVRTVKGKIVDPIVILNGANAVLSVLSHGLSVVAQALTLVLPFL
ncbi:Uncharacterised protein [Nocardia farcinica]|nr:Uncharacterised protein [Nocardia farcinica]